MANAITLVRLPLLFIYIGLLYTRQATIIFWCVPFILLIMLLDMFDGMVARYLDQTSLLGSALDIAVDRALEIILWVVFCLFGLIPLVIPLIVITRGTLTDAVRCVGSCSGKPAFQQLHTPLNRFLVASRFMRNLYGILKGTAFVTLTLDLGLQLQQHRYAEDLHVLALGLSWLAVSLTLLRGFPVVQEEVSAFRQSRETELLRDEMP